MILQNFFTQSKHAQWAKRSISQENRKKSLKITFIFTCFWLV